jgi:hypothetical protein
MTITKVTDAGLDRSRIVTPLIINGDMSVAQRGTSATGKTGSGIYAVDRMNLGIDSLGTWTITQETISSGEAYNNGFTKAFRVDCTTADASPSASDNIFFNIKLEGQTLQSIKKGTSNAESLTISFYVKSNKTGTGQVLLQDKDNSRNVGKTYTINSANTWEKKVINFPADTTGAFDNDNAKSLEIEWALDAGSNFTGGTLPATWTSSNNNQRAVNNFSLGDSTDNDWAITGVQLEVGEFDANTIPSFPFESFDVNLQRCKRYFQSWGGNDAYEHLPFYGLGDGTVANFNFDVPVEMRSSPSLSIESSWRIQAPYNGSIRTPGSFALSNSTNKSIRGEMSSISADIGTNTGRVFALNNLDARFNLDAEL